MTFIYFFISLRRKVGGKMKERGRRQEAGRRRKEAA
jgi:hypothetical protein